MKNAFKLGFGLVLGCELAKITVQVVSKLIVDAAVRNDKFMDDVKETDPELYEEIKDHTEK